MFHDLRDSNVSVELGRVAALRNSVELISRRTGPTQYRIGTIEQWAIPLEPGNAEYNQGQIQRAMRRARKLSRLYPAKAILVYAQQYAVTVISNS